MAATQQTQLLPGVFAFFDLAPLKRCLLHKLPLSCIDSELLLQHPELTMNRKLTFPWVFGSFFVDLNRRLSSNQSSRISWNPLKHYSCNMNIFYLKKRWVRCWICIFYLKNWCNFFYRWVLQYTQLNTGLINLQLSRQHWEPEHHLKIDTWAVRSAQNQPIFFEGVNPKYINTEFAIITWNPKK